MENWSEIRGRVLVRRMAIIGNLKFSLLNWPTGMRVTLNGIQEVRGSNPLGSTIRFANKSRASIGALWLPCHRRSCELVAGGFQGVGKTATDAN